MDVTWPEVSTRASNFTLSELLVAKSDSAFGEAIARTDLINFGGTMATPSEGGTAETSAALLNDSDTERFAVEVETSGFSCSAAASSAASGDDLALTAVSATAVVDGFTAPVAADCGASCKAALEGTAGDSLVCGDLLETTGAFEVC